MSISERKNPELGRATTAARRPSGRRAAKSKLVALALHRHMPNRVASQGQPEEIGDNLQRLQTASLKAVAILPLLLKSHTPLKSLKVHVSSIDTKPSPDSI
jgi:hypothetical protein